MQTLRLKKKKIKKTQNHKFLKESNLFDESAPKPEHIKPKISFLWIFDSKIYLPELKLYLNYFVQRLLQMENSLDHFSPQIMICVML